MSSAEPTDHETSSGHLAGIMYIQAKDPVISRNDGTAVRFAVYGISRRSARENRRSKTFRAWRKYTRLNEAIKPS
eukprot:265356-Pyramimonas_sp.AAC.1